MKSLTKGEEQIMQVLWELKQGFLKDILEHTPEPKPHSNTVATLIKILVDKGFIAFETQGRNNLYKPLVSKQEYGKRSINHLIKGYFGGSPANLVSQFVSDDKLTDDELDVLLKQIRTAKKKKS